MSETEAGRVVVIGAGVAGLTAGTFTARAGFDTVFLADGGSVLRRNAHLENVPGSPPESAPGSSSISSPREPNGTAG